MEFSVSRFPLLGKSFCISKLPELDPSNAFAVLHTAQHQTWPCRASSDQKLEVDLRLKRMLRRASRPTSYQLTRRSSPNWSAARPH